MGRGESWPRCADCDGRLELQLQLQIDLAKFARGLRPVLTTESASRVLRGWHCETCREAWCDWLVGDPPLEALDRETDVSEIRLGSRKARDLPQFGSLELWSPETYELFDDFEEYWIVEEEIDCGDESKCQVGGYGRWIQDDATPFCEQCEKPMHLLCQIPTDDELEIEWAADADLYVFYCPTHAKALKWVEQYT